MQAITDWFRRHFGGRMSYHEITQNTENGGIWFGETTGVVLVSYRGEIYGFHKTMLRYFPDKVDFLKYLTYIFTASAIHMNPKDVQARGQLKTLGSRALEELQKKQGAVLFMAYVNESTLTLVNEEFATLSKEKQNESK